jgi:hypothetical protein
MLGKGGFVAMADDHMVQDQIIQLQISCKKSAEFADAASYKHSLLAGRRMVGSFWPMHHRSCVTGELRW